MKFTTALGSILAAIAVFSSSPLAIAKDKKIKKGVSPAGTSAPESPDKEETVPQKGKPGAPAATILQPAPPPPEPKPGEGGGW